MSASDADLSECWDVAIIGSGMGGATVAWALASRGFSVLILEKGGGVGAGQSEAEAATPEARLARGLWPNQISQRRSDGTCDRFFAPVGCALGGSSIYYAAALERMAPTDFETLQAVRQIVPPWVATFDEFKPYYEQAESLYGIDPLSSDAAERRISEWDRALMEAMRRNGLKPELLHVAMRYDEECEECVGKICPRECKADSRTACLGVALRQPRCRVLDYCDVQTLDANEKTVRAIRALRFGRDIEVQARIVVWQRGLCIPLRFCCGLAMIGGHSGLQTAPARWAEI